MDPGGPANCLAVVVKVPDALRTAFWIWLSSLYAGTISKNSIVRVNLGNPNAHSQCGILSGTCTKIIHRPSATNGSGSARLANVSMHVHVPRARDCENRAGSETVQDSPMFAPGIRDIPRERGHLRSWLHRTHLTGSWQGCGIFSLKEASESVINKRFTVWPGVESILTRQIRLSWQGVAR